MKRAQRCGWAPSAKSEVGVVVLALIQPWGRKIPRWLLLAWGAGTLLFVHGGLFVVVGVLALSGTICVGTPLLMLRWYTFLWGPWWLLGGILFLLVAWIALRRSPKGRVGLVFAPLVSLEHSSCSS